MGPTAWTVSNELAKIEPTFEFADAAAALTALALPSLTEAQQAKAIQLTLMAKQVVSVKLTMGGRTKKIRHGAATSISQLLRQYEEQRKCILVAKDAQGFELGLEVLLGQLAA